LTNEQWLLRVGYLADMSLKLNEISLSLQRKELTLLFASDNICAFKQKLEFWKTVPPTVNLTGSQYLKTFLMRLVLITINEMFLILNHEIYQHLEELNYLRPIFSK
jgi:hypothetical protein